MFLLICGEDVVQSRNYLQQTKESYRKKHTQIFEVASSELEHTLQSDQTHTLFGDPIVLVTTGLLGYWGKAKKKAVDQIQLLNANQDHTVINWEDGKSLYELKLKPGPSIKEFKLSASLFDLQDSCVPGKRAQFISTLRKATTTQDSFLVFSILRKHIRLLILLKTKQPAAGNPYVLSKTTQLAQKWELAKLQQMYLGIARIDHAAKTSATPYSMSQSLEILACYYL